MKNFVYNLLIYICNYWVSSVPILGFRLWFYRNLMGFRIGRGTCIMMGARFSAPRRLKIGDHCVINENCCFGNRGDIEIGDCVVIAADCHLRSGDHDMNDPEFGTRYEKISIGDHVFLGLRATVLKGVNLGRGAVICACALVAKPVGDYEIVAGVPAKKIGERERDLVYVPDWQPLFH